MGPELVVSGLPGCQMLVYFIPIPIGGEGVIFGVVGVKLWAWGSGITLFQQLIETESLKLMSMDS